MLGLHTVSLVSTFQCSVGSVSPEGDSSKAAEFPAVISVRGE